MDTLLLFQTLTGPVELDASAIVGHIATYQSGEGGFDTARVIVPSPSALTLWFATNEEASQAVERIHAARVAYRAEQARSPIDEQTLARALVTEVMGDGNSRLRWAMIASAATEAAKAGARELVASLVTEPTPGGRWVLIKSALSEAAKAGAREYAERTRVTIDRIECPVVPVFATKQE